MQAKELLTRTNKEKEALQKRLAALLKDSTHVSPRPSVRHGSHAQGPAFD